MLIHSSHPFPAGPLTTDNSAQLLVGPGPLAHEPSHPKHVRNATLLFINCCPHSAREESFWCAVRDGLGRHGIQFVMFHTWQAIETAVPLVSLGRAALSVKVPEAITQYDDFRQRAENWGRAVTESDYRQVRNKLAETLLLTRPDFVLIWSGEQPSDRVLRPMLDAAGCEYAIVERTPWPGMLSLDRRGILADCQFLSVAPHWECPQQRSEALLHFELYEKHVRESQVTWWQQPQPESAEVVGMRPPDRLLPILFAGQVDADTQNFLFSPHFKTNLDAFNWFLQATDREPVWVLGKHHPWSETPIADYQHAIGSRAARWRDDITVSQALGEVSGVVATNSSILCEALIHRRPAFALGRTMIAGCGALEQLQDPKDNNQLSAWLRRIRAADGRLTPSQVAEWCEFSAFHFRRHLYAMEGPKPLMQQRGAACLADEITQRLRQSPVPNWSRLFEPHEAVRYQQRLAQLRERRDSLRPLADLERRSSSAYSVAGPLFEANCRQLQLLESQLEAIRSELSATGAQLQQHRAECRRQLEQIATMLERSCLQQVQCREAAQESQQRLQRLESLWPIRGLQWWQSHIAKWIRSVAKRLPGRSHP
jgi:hypothetical protein